MTSEGIRYSNIDPDHEIKRGAVRDRSGGAAQAEPMLRRDVAFGDCEEAGESRLGSQEIVTVAIERAFVDEISDRQQLPVVVEQETELHRKRHRPRRAFENSQPFTLDAGRLCDLREIVTVGFDRTQDRTRPKQHIRARSRRHVRRRARWQCRP